MRLLPIRFNRLINFSAYLLITALTVGCAVPIKTDAVATGGQQRIFRDGIPALISSKQSVVLVSPSTVVREGKDRLRLVVSVVNISTTTFDLNTTDFSATVDGRQLKILTYDEITREIKSKQAWAAFGMALAGGMQAASAQQQAGYARTTGTYNSNTAGTVNAYGTRGSTYGNYNSNTSGTYEGWAYNPAAGQAAAAAVNAQTSANIANLQANGQSALNEAARNILKQTTVFPQNSHGGQIVLAEFEVPEIGALLELTAKIQGEIHQFQFTQRRQK